MFSVFLFMFIFLAIRNSLLVYFFKYYLNVDSQREFLGNMDKGLFGLLGTLGVMGEKSDIASNTFSFVNIVSQLVSLLGIAFSKPLATRLGKRNAFRSWLIVAGVFAGLFMAVPSQGVIWAFVLSLLFNFAWGVTMPLPWAMMADVADYGEWKTKRRATAIVFAGVVIGLKVGLAIGGYIALQLLDVYGYVANAVQTPEALHGIRLTLSIYPVIALACCVVLLFIYGINRKVEYQMQDELAERRKQY
jgi:Na+/melibiose symporter-like transporter